MRNISRFNCSTFDQYKANSFLSVSHPIKHWLAIYHIPFLCSFVAYLWWRRTEGAETSWYSKDNLFSWSGLFSRILLKRVKNVFCFAFSAFLRLLSAKLVIAECVSFRYLKDFEINSVRKNNVLGSLVAVFSDNMNLKSVSTLSTLVNVRWHFFNYQMLQVKL